MGVKEKNITFFKKLYRNDKKWKNEKLESMLMSVN